MKFDDTHFSSGTSANTNKPGRQPLKDGPFSTVPDKQAESSILFNTVSKFTSNSEMLSAKMDAGTVLIVDDSIEIRQALSRDLSSLGYKPLTAATHKQALRYLEDGEDDVRIAIVDLVLGREDGLALLEVLAERWPNMRRILMSGYVLPVTLDLVRSCGRAHAVMSKPWNRESLAQIIVGEKTE
jgi:ActR/RegA family two-component response regulator